MGKYYLHFKLWIQSSLRRRLLFWLLPTTFLVGVLASIGTYWGAYLQLEDLLNDQMQYIAKNIDVTSNQRITLNRKNTKFSIDEDKVVFQLWHSGKLTFSTSPEINIPPPEKDGFSNIQYADMTWHSFVDKRGDVSIRISQPQNSRWETLASLAIQLFWPVLSLIPILALVLWFGIGNGIKPLHKIATELEKRNVNSMESISTDTLPNEIKPLIISLNNLFNRLEKSFTIQKNFIADAAHELRTPVMAISLQAELVQKSTNLSEQKQAIEQLKQGSVRLNHLTQQLLTLARLEPELSDNIKNKVELSGLCKSIILNKYLLAERKQIDLGFDSNEKVYITGDYQMLSIMLNNLIDNAILYTPSRGKIDISVHHTDTSTELSVRDNGPGIPVEDRKRVLERFYRGQNQSIQGSGLGLSIVKRVAEHHKASVILESADSNKDKGLNVRILFPVETS